MIDISFYYETQSLVTHHSGLENISLPRMACIVILNPSDPSLSLCSVKFSFDFQRGLCWYGGDDVSPCVSTKVN